MVTAATEGNVCPCGRPVADAYLCPSCVEDLTVALLDTAPLAAALESAYLKEQRFSVGHLSEHRDDESPIPFNDKAGRLRRELSRELLRWTLQVQCAFGETWMPVPAGGKAPTRAMAERLMAAIPYLRTNPAGVDAHRTFTGLHARILEAVDRPPDLVYLGVCSIPADGVDCPEDLYAEWGKDHAQCRRCKYQHRVLDRRNVLLGAVKDQLATATDISRGLAGLDFKCSAERIRQWKHRKRIEQRGTNYQGDPQYRVGDVIDLLLKDAERAEKQQQRKGKK